MKTYQVHPFSVTVGALAAALLLFACSSSGAGSSSPSNNPNQTPATTTTPVTFYSRTPVPLDGGVEVFLFGAVAEDTVITDISFETVNPSSTRDRILVDGVPVYGWGFGGVRSGQLAFGSTDGLAVAVAPRISLTHGILIPAGSTLTVETLGENGFIALAGYTTS